MLRFASSLLASAILVSLATAAFGHAITPAQPKIIATVVAHARPSAEWIATAPHGL
ncbi:MAG TPA: hypothetical protein VFN49_03230 [Candidatus Aquilonibacter sp.]|nr:hypothetical protein [Candidatus Aquilonibacter sp.]